MSPKSPLPLEGEGVGGWGERTGLNAEGAGGGDEGCASRDSLAEIRANTPTQPSPLEGEGYRKRRQIKPGGVQRARRLRAQPTRAEQRLWERLRRLEVRFRRQAPIGPYVADFVCHAAKLIIEVDGGVHDTFDVAVRDLKRDEWLTAEGFRVLRFSNRRIDDDLDGVMSDIITAVSAVRPIAPHAPSASEFVCSPLSQPFPPRGERA